MTDEGPRGEALGINATTPPETDPNRPPESEADGPAAAAPPPASPPLAEDDEPPLSRPAAMTRSAFDDRSPRFLLGTIALAVVVALICGFVIGYKVENSKGTSKPAKKAAAVKRHPKKPRTVKFGAKAAPLLIGGVYSAKPKQLVVLNSSAKGVKIGMGAKTKVVKTEPGNSSSITVGSKVFFQPSTSSRTKAVEVVVLPKKAPVGAAVTAVTPGQSMTIIGLDGKPVVITTSGATIDEGHAGQRKNIAKSDHVIVYYYLVRGKRNSAVEVVVLPSGTKFKQPSTTTTTTK